MGFPFLHVALGFLNVIMKTSTLLGITIYVFALTLLFYISNDVSEGVAIFANPFVIITAMHSELFVIAVT